VFSDKPERLLNKNFLLLWQGQFVSRLGSQAFTVAMMFWIKRETGSATLMGAVTMLSMLPMVLLGPIGGTFADLHSRRRIIIACDVIHGVTVLSLAALLLGTPEATTLAAVWLAVVAVVSGVVSAFFQPAITAAIPSIVPSNRVAAANSLNEGSFQTSTLIGQGIGGVLFRLLGAPVMFLIDGLTFLYAAASEAFISIPQTIPERADSIRGRFRRHMLEVREGLRHVWARAGMRNLFLASALLNFFAMPYPVLFPFYVEDVLGATPDWFGYLMAAYGAGSLLGYALWGSLRVSGRRRMRMLVFLLVAVSLCLAAVGWSRDRWLSLVLIVAAGVFSGAYNVAAITLIQLSTAEELRGRMFGLLNTLVLGLTPLSMGLAGVAADLLDHRVAVIFMVCGGALVVISIAIAANRAYRDFLAS